jgi:hypothetical protein
MDKKDLLKLIEDDDLGLLKVQPKTSAITADERLLASFEEIIAFTEKNKREPAANEKDIGEFKLHSRLLALRGDPAKAQALVPYDRLGLLKDVRAVKSMSEIFKDDDLGVLTGEAESIFALKHVQRPIKEPDFIAKRKPCKDFAKFEARFRNCQEDLRAKRRQMRPFANGSRVDAGQFFVLNGVLLLIESVGTRKVQNKDVNARLHVIFENGTESNMLLRSLSRALYRDGRRVTELGEKLLDGLAGVTAEDAETGFIYVVRSLSERPEIKSQSDLFKVGFSRVPVEERVKNAHLEPTYLMDPVAIVATYKCYNLNPQKLELLLHTFFGRACLDVDIIDATGKRFVPREWFIAPLDVIEQAIHFVLSGEIVNFRYDVAKKTIVTR